MTVKRLVLILVVAYCGYAAYLTNPAFQRLHGDKEEPVLQKYHGADFGGYYTGATAAARGELAEFTDADFQLALQQRIQADENTGWRWFNPLPHPSVLSLITMPISAFPIREAYWYWVLLSFISAGLSALIAGRALVPALAVPLVALMLTFEPLWHLVWWGQVDALILMPVATGFAWLIRSRTDRKDWVAGILIGFLALVPQYAILPFLTLCVARRRAAGGMMVTGGVLAAITLAVIRLDGLRGYIDFYRSYGQLGADTTVTERAMFNVRGMVFRLDERSTGIDLSLATFGMVVLVVSGALAVLTIYVAGRAMARNRAPDLAVAMLVVSTVITAYHTHRQTLVFFLIPMAVVLKRAYESRRWWIALLWLVPAGVFHAETALLRVKYRLADYPIQNYLTPWCVAAVLAVAVVLLAAEWIRTHPPRPEYEI